MTPLLTGSCLCGAIAFEVTREPLWAHYCHCSRCRKITGAASAPNLFAPLEGLRFTRGESQLRSYQLPGAVHFRHVFCERCGSNMPFADETLELAVIPMGSLDGDLVRLAPRAHMFVGSKAPWVTISDSLPQNLEGGRWELGPGS